MFGYVRPRKTELKIKDFTWYRAIYCGLCKSLKREYGELPRLATNYDLTFMALLLLSFHETEPGMNPERCIANMIRKHGIAREHPVLDFTAACAVLLASHKLQDNVNDNEKAFLSKSALLAFRGSIKKAEVRYPQLAAVINEGMYETSVLERESKKGENSGQETPPERFGRMLSVIFELGLDQDTIDEITLTALKMTAADLGSWIYYIDALDDYYDDTVKGRYNVLSELDHIVLNDEDIRGYAHTVGFMANKNISEPQSDTCSSCNQHKTHKEEEPCGNIDPKEIRNEEWLFMKAASLLRDLEESIDRQLALLTYKRFGDLVANIVCEGLFEMRMTILRRQKPGRL